jgi:hypothetical protein
VHLEGARGGALVVPAAREGAANHAVFQDLGGLCQRDSAVQQVID